MEVPLERDVDQFPVFELVLKKRGRIWRWSVCTSEGAVVMEGSESSRPAAKYQAVRALFLLLLSAPYQSIRMSRANDVRPHRRDAGAQSKGRESFQPRKDHHWGRRKLARDQGSWRRRPFKVLANDEAAEKWFEEHDPEGDAFEYEVQDYGFTAGARGNPNNCFRLSIKFYRVG